MFKVGDRVVGNGNGWRHRQGDFGTVVKGLNDKRTTEVLWDEESSYHCGVTTYSLKLAPPIGKPITELNLQVGDVVVATDDDLVPEIFVCTSEMTKFRSYQLHNNKRGHIFLGDTTGLWQIVSRAADTKTPHRMHPDDFVNAVNEFAADNGFTLNSVTCHTPLGAVYTWYDFNQPPAN